MTIEKIEMHEEACVVRKQSCRRFWHSLPEHISRTVEHFFYRLGVHIAQNPYKWLLGCFVAVLICILGMLRFRIEKNPMNLWVPPDSDFVTDTEWLMSHSLKALRIQTFILTGDNILEQQSLIRLNDITKQMISVRTPVENISWTDVCMKIPFIKENMLRVKRQSSLLEDNFFDDDFTEVNKTFEPSIHVDSNMYCSVIESLPMGCILLSILDIWNFDSAKIERDSMEEIITKINTIKVSPTMGHAVNFSDLLGDVTLDEKGRIIAATAVRTSMMVYINFLNVDMDKIGNLAGTADWVRQQIKY